MPKKFYEVDPRSYKLITPKHKIQPKEFYMGCPWCWLGLLLLILMVSPWDSGFRFWLEHFLEPFPDLEALRIDEREQSTTANKYIGFSTVCQERFNMSVRNALMGLYSVCQERFNGSVLCLSGTPTCLSVRYA
jgi:hypothetical protein